MIKLKKRIFLMNFFMVTAFIFCLSPFVFAVGDYDDLITDNSTGWSFNDLKAHRGSKNFYYAYDSVATKNDYSSYFENARTSWSTYINMTETTSLNYGIIKTISNPVSNAAAITTMPSYYASTGHYTDVFYIAINKPVFDTLTNDMKRKALIHEIGHVYGLSHFTDNTAPKIMNPTLVSTMSIRTSDLRGLTVCTHSHSHGSTYNYSVYTNLRHRKRCTICAAYYLEPHNYNSSGVCTKCGYSG